MQKFAFKFTIICFILEIYMISVVTLQTKRQTLIELIRKMKERTLIKV